MGLEEGIIRDRARRPGFVLLALAASLLAVPSARATFRYGDVQISGNVEQQTLVRTPEIDELHPVQQRNTLRQERHRLRERPPRDLHGRKAVSLPVSFRIGRQQMNWGEADQFRALDSVNPIDLTWHLNRRPA